MHQVEGKTLIWTETPLLVKAYKDGEGRWYLASYISSTRRDRDGDAFSKSVLNSWANTINAGKINFGSDHSESWKDTLGVWKNASVMHNSVDNIDYLYAEALLEDPTINKNVELLLHKASLGEQISLSIAANPPTMKSSNWYERSLDENGNAVRTILQADLLKADIVGEPSNPDARFLGVVLKHNKESGCDDTCPICFFNKQISGNINKMEHGKEEEEEKKKKEEEEKSTPNAELEKFIQQLKDARKSNVTIDLPTLVTGVLSTISKAPAAGESGTLPDAKITASPGNSGTGPSGNALQGTPAPGNSSATNNVPNEPTKIIATPGISGPGGGSNTSQPIPQPADLSAGSNAGNEPAKINAGTQPEIKKRVRTVFATRERLEELRKNAKPKNESPGELLPLTGDNKEVNLAIAKIIAEQVKKQYSVEELVKMAEGGQLVKELDPNGLFIDAVKAMGRKPSNQPSIKKVKSIFLQKREV